MLQFLFKPRVQVDMSHLNKQELQALAMNSSDRHAKFLAIEELNKRFI